MILVLKVDFCYFVQLLCMEKCLLLHDGRMSMHDCITQYVYILCKIYKICLPVHLERLREQIRFMCNHTIYDESYQAQKSESEVRCRWNGASIPIFGRDQLCVYMLLKYE